MPYSVPILTGDTRSRINSMSIPLNTSRGDYYLAPGFSKITSWFSWECPEKVW